ncbi:MATE family efflux transporter [Dendrosporobacter sp. 1207_IL3150]|uniref:MATE family efflux transporter n=1 Tax=Dendrosporobacter sp. 1207_IL3150 TaxID=3084054 RepID=UPI002FDA5820
MLPIKRYMQIQIISLAWPVVLEMVWIMVVNILLTAMVGSFGAVALASVGLSGLVQFSTAMIFAAAGTGSSALISREWGAKNNHEVRVIAGQALQIGGILGILLSAVGFYIAPAFFVFTGAEQNIAELAGQLLRINFLSTPLFMIFAIGNAVLRGIGQTRTAFYISSFANTVVLIVSYILIFGLLSPALGAYGAAWGTCLGQAIGGIIVLVVLKFHKSICLDWTEIFIFRADVIKRILAISIPAALEQVSLQGGRIVFTLLLASVGSVQFAAHQIAMQVESISFMPGFGFSVAAMTLVGQYLGKGMTHRAVQYVWLTCKMAFGGMAVMGLVFFIFAEELTSLFINDPEVVFWGAICVKIAALEQITIAITYVFGGALRGAGDTKWPFYITTIGVWVVRMPLIYLFINVWHYDITAAWFITAGDFLVRSIILWWRFATSRWESKENACGTQP